MGNTLCCSTANVNEMIGAGLPPKLDTSRRYKEPINPNPISGDQF